MKKLILLFVFLPVLVFANSLPYDTTFDCAEWQGSSGNYDPSCDGLTFRDGSCSGNYSQVTTSANYASGGGGRGGRVWFGDGKNVHSGPPRVSFTEDQDEIWIRYYMRYPEGFAWDRGDYPSHKILYFGSLYVENSISRTSWVNDSVRVVFAGFQEASVSDKGFGYVNGGATGDGLFHSYEFYVKFGDPGIVRVWIDDELIMDREDLSINNAAVNHVVPFDNMGFPLNLECLPIDFDDLVVYNTTPPNTDADGNAFIGSLDWNGTPSISAPSGLRVVGGFSWQ